MSVNGIDYCDDLLVARRAAAPGSVNRNRNKSSKPGLAKPEPRQAVNPVSAPSTPLKSSKSPSFVTNNTSLGQVRKSRSAITPKHGKTRNFSTSPTLSMMDAFKDPTLYDEPIDLAVPSMTNLPPVRSSSACDRVSPCSALPPLPIDVVDYDVVFSSSSETITSNYSPPKVPEMSLNVELPPLPDNLFVMAVAN